MGPEHHSVLCVCMCVSLCVLHTWNWKYRKRRTSFVTEKPFSLMHHKTFDVESFNVTLQIFFLKHLQHQLELKVQLAGGSGQKACSLFPVCVHQTIQTHLIWYTSEEQGMKGLSAGTKSCFAWNQLSYYFLRIEIMIAKKTDVQVQQAVVITKTETQWWLWLQNHLSNLRSATVKEVLWSQKERFFFSSYKDET